MTDDTLKERWQVNGNWFTVIAPRSDNTAGAAFLFVITIVLLVALLRAWGRERRLLTDNAGVGVVPTKPS